MWAYTQTRRSAISPMREMAVYVSSSIWDMYS